MRFDGIKKADVKLRRNRYVISKSRSKILWRYIAALIIVFAVMITTAYSDYDAAELFRQDYVEQYAKD